MEKTVDASGTICPYPIMLLSRAVREARPGDVIKVVATDPAFARDVKSWTKSTGNELLALEEGEGKVVALVRKVGR
ncbi:transcriptional regulator [Sulfodiicoccus acidiphilus]|uniref:Transcriptional regulator n=1 Tax=Sulfodiicoccus acidiphilus TaxID=1670455 RepID=A0A348B250_9CREN|nr:sulfurtransferase TusA family protein [Sulfodiicoccus acidiphilus]BBD72252.1 transcriptional regulator [Sulfodiicoccus acidiphilus]GGT90773.1 transcriptional regulator [Sulfodiicoccus acidiphilus]